MKIILVRHGESEYNAKTTEHHNSPLTKKGVIQAKHLGKRLKKEGINIDEIYTSTLIRSKQTAEIISGITKIPIKKSFEELNEYRSSYITSGLIRLTSQRLKALKNILNELLKNKSKEKIILIVAHGRTNRIIIAHLLQIPMGRHLHRLVQHNTGLSVLSWNETYKNWTLESLNDLAHIPRRPKN